MYDDVIEVLVRPEQRVARVAVVPHIFHLHPRIKVQSYTIQHKLPTTTQPLNTSQ